MRFARSKGSKASNERCPEEATPWQTMRDQFQQKKQDVDEQSKRDEFNALKEAKYKSFLEEESNVATKIGEWANFSDNEDNLKKHQNKLVSKPKFKKSEHNMKLKLGKIKSETVKNISKQPSDFMCDRSVEDVKSPDSQSLKKPKKLKKRKGNGEILNNDANRDNEQLVVKEKHKKGKEKKDAKKIKVSPSIDAPETKEMSQESLGEEKKINNKKLKKMRQFERKKHIKNKNCTEIQEAKGSSTKKTRKNVCNDREYKRRKPHNENVVVINGKQVEIALFDGFPIKKEDFNRLTQLKEEMIAKGIPRSEVQRAMKLERRRAEKSLAREKKKVCFHCRLSGHNLSECPALNDDGQDLITSGICFKCGSTEHTHFECRVVRGQEFKFAQCFVCKEQGHIARQCPDNSRGVYPKGGACRVCGDVTHLKKDCPKFQIQQNENLCKLETINEQHTENTMKLPVIASKNKIIKF